MLSSNPCILFFFLDPNNYIYSLLTSQTSNNTFSLILFLFLDDTLVFYFALKSNNFKKTSKPYHTNIYKASVCLFYFFRGLYSLIMPKPSFTQWITLSLVTKRQLSSFLYSASQFFRSNEIIPIMPYYTQSSCKKIQALHCSTATFLFYFFTFFF